MRGRIFIKIFFGFWLVTTAILGSWMLATEYFESQPGSEHSRTPQHGPPHRFMLRTIYELQNIEDDQLKPLLQRLQEEHGVEVYLLDREGGDLYGREVPASVASIAEKLRGGRRRAFDAGPRSHLLAHTVYRREQGLLRAVFVMPPRQHGVIGALGSNLSLRIALAVLVSGLICYLLSRLMTKRLKALQLASRRLAEGDLDTRLQVRDRGGDETDELARDFNSMAEQLQERIQAQRRLLGDVSHELRSPLARLRIALALAEKDQQNRTRHLQRIEHEAERLEELIAQLLSSQGQDIHFDVHIDLVELLQQLCADARFEGEAQGKRVELEHSEDQAVVASSGDLLHKSLENILRNAVLHTANNSTVKVDLQKQQDEYRIRITDRGPGVPEEELHRIFDEFYRVDTARTRDTGGYGLGLAIARRAVQRHGGQLLAENTGSGLAVTVVLPVAT